MSTARALGRHLSARSQYKERNEAQGRPVGVAMDKAGALLVADDVGNTVWRVTSATPHAAVAP